MASIDEMRMAEAEREAREAAARRQWEANDLRRMRRDIVDMEFDDELLEEALRRAAEKGI